MKKLTTILFLLLALSISFAQNSKPTKEETVQFIKSEQNGVYYRTLSTVKVPNSYYQKFLYLYTYKNTNIKMDACIMEILVSKKVTETANIINYNDRRADENYNDEVVIDKNDIVTIDLSRIESIYCSATEGGYDQTNGVKTVTSIFVEIVFKQKEADGTYHYISIPLGNYSADATNFTDNKIYKAFQHLRKLCGAPEPISFD